ncbi:MAG: nickel pincer cofactor biosynthesis protein LarC [Actinomycetota bacterium]
MNGSTTTRTAWINPAAGIAGDMVLAALIDAGADVDAVRASIAALGVDGIELRIERTQRAGITATHVDVHTSDTATHRAAAEVIDLIARAELPPTVAERATAIVGRLAEVEGALHDVDPADVMLHEVGALDSIADIVGVCAALDALSVEEVAAAPVGLGTGTVRSAHGTIPGPAPATMALLTEAGIPVRGVDTELETATPTGAAIVAALATSVGSIPAMTPIATGYGAGTADPPDRANVTQIVIGDTLIEHTAFDGTAIGNPTTEHGGSSADGATVEQLVVLDTNLDDVTGEVLAYTVERVLAAGAADAWTTAITMKKGRPAQQLSVLCEAAQEPELRALVMAETGTLGVRATPVTRWAANRTVVIADVDDQQIRVKRSADRDKAEFDDATAAARTLGRPLREILAAAVERVRPANRRSSS